MLSLREQINPWRALRSWRPYFLILVLGFLLYSQTLFFDYTYLDDQELIVNKLVILQDFKNVGQLFATDVFFSQDKFYYRPILNLSFMIDTQLGGAWPLTYHFSNICLHLLAVCLVFYFFKKIIKKLPLAFFLSLIFLVHPVLTQAVAWLPGRNDSLLTIFVLLSFIAFLKFSERPRLKFYLGHLFFLLIALLTKESAVFLPALVILYFLLIDRWSLTKNDKYLLVFGEVAVGIIWFLMRHLALGGEPTNYLMAISGILKNSPAILISLGKLILPFNLSVLPVLADTTLIYGIIVLGLLILVWFLSREKRNKYLIFGTVWFFLFLLPSFIRLNTLPDFLEHRLYLSLIGFLIVLAEFDFIKNLDFKKKAVKIMAVSLLLIFSGLTFWHSLNFRNRLIFWRAAATSSPSSPLAQRNLGAMYYFDGQTEQSLRYYRRALELNPREPMAHNNIGLIYLEQGSYGQAEKEFKKELSLYPNYDIALFNLGELYFKERRFTEAADLWRATLRANPAHNEAYQRLLNLKNQLR